MTEMMIHRMTMTLLMMIPQAPTVRPAAVLPVAAVLQDRPLQAGAGVAPVLVRDQAQVHQAGAAQAHRAAAPLHLLRNQVLLMMILQAPEAVIPMVTN